MMLLSPMNWKRILVAFFVILVLIIFFTFHPSLAQENKVIVGENKNIGIASWYSRRDPGVTRHTANGEIFDDRKLTCATRRDSFGTKLKVTNLKNGKSVVCRVNDRGPHRRLNRHVDLTKTAFKRIADSKHGVVRVSVSRISLTQSEAA